eukprot:GHRR01002893.1.p1 GENE.GHRR01002893.1~~GHRR01002893.1.p1  ORF type:complete len:728 (+),score=275.11 GHRR01002893.1:55-2184(+)
MALARDKAKLAVAAVKGEDTQDLYVAVTKATLPDEVVPKEKHVRTLRIACSAHSPRHTVEYVAYKLAKRLSNPSWVVVLKALMTFHRLLRECDASFQEQLLRFAERTGRHHLLALDRFADHTGKDAWDYSAWIRVYSAYLDERVDVYRTMRFDPEGNVPSGSPKSEQLQQQQTGQPYGNGAAAAGPYSGATGAYGNPYAGATGAVGPYAGAPGAYGGPYGGPTGAYAGPTGAYAGPTGANGYGAYGGPTGAAANTPPPAPVKLKDCSTTDLLQHLPRMQRLMGRLLMCVPEGSSAMHPVILTSCSWVLRESRAIYKAASEGVMNLADKFFEMERAQAMQGIEMYKDNLALGEKLNLYYAAMQNLPALKNVIQYPQLAPLPADFLTAMEDYVKEAPKEVDPNASPRRGGAGPLAANRVSNLVARGGSTSSAIAGSSSLNAPGSQPATPTAEQAAAAAAAVAAAAAQAEELTQSQKAPEIDLLTFDDEPAPAPAAAAAPTPPRGELDDLADGMNRPVAGTTGGGATANGFEESAAFGVDGQAVAGQPPPYGMHPQNPYGPYAGPTGAYGYPPDPYAAANPFGMNPYGPYAGPTGGMGPQSMAIVPVGPVGGMGMAMVPYGMGPFAGQTGALPQSAGGAVNPFNPFLATAPAAVPVETGPVRLANDPLNELTEELLGPPRKKAEGPQPTLNEIKQGHVPDRQLNLGPSQQQQ